MHKFSLIILLFCSITFGQNKAIIDSLLTVVESKKTTDSLKIEAYTKIIYEYMYVDKDSTLSYSNKLFKYSKAIKSDYAMHYSHYSRAFYFYTTSQFDSVIYHLEKSIYYGNKSNNLKLAGEGHSKLSGVYAMLNQKEKAIENSTKALSIATKIKDWVGVGYANLDIGNIHFYGNELDVAIYYFQKVDSILSIHKPLDISLGNALLNIGNIFLSQDQDNKAKIYFDRATKLFAEMQYNHGIQVVAGRLGEVDVKQKRYNEAINKLTSSLDYFEEIGDDLKASENFALLGIAYFEVNQKATSFQVLDKALALKKKVKDSLGLLTTLLTTGDLKLKNNEPNKSLSIANEALDLSKKIKSLVHEKKATLLLIKSHAALQNYKDAYLQYEAYNTISDSLASIQNLQKVQDLEAQYQAEKKEQEIALLTSQNEVTIKQKTNQRNLLLAGLGITTIAGIFFFFLYKNRQKTNKKLKELDTIKSNFFANISHEFRTPLTLISGPIEKQLDKPNLEIDDRKDFEMVQRNSKRLLNLVNQLLDLSKLESGNLKLQVKEGAIELLLNSLASSFQYQAELDNINYLVEIEEVENAWYDADAIEKIVINLLSNAFKYVPKGGKVQFKSTVNNQNLELVFENDGKIEGNQKIDQIFNRFYQTDDSADGVGIGLALVKELVALYRGTIDVKNTENKTVLFKIKLPIFKDQFLNEELLFETTESARDKKRPILETLPLKRDEISNINEDAPILLVVEDNEDIRNFVKSTFEKEYQVLEAKNGAEGIEIAITCIPDIIISDIMMPIMDGLQLCKKLKIDERTSHIPIVLLTAKVEDQSQYEGLELGADDYVLKPFKTKFLETRVKNLISSRKQLRNRFSQEVVLKPKNISISRVDEKFIEKVQTILDENLTDSNFSIEDFSNLISMSRMQLHRKLKALTGLTASEFVRSQRLKLATTLLKESDVNISEICYQVGFNNPSYFTKCFKEAYGCLPSEYS